MDAILFIASLGIIVFIGGKWFLQCVDDAAKKSVLLERYGDWEKRWKHTTCGFIDRWWPNYADHAPDVCKHCGETDENWTKSVCRYTRQGWEEKTNA